VVCASYNLILPTQMERFLRFLLRGNRRFEVKSTVGKICQQQALNKSVLFAALTRPPKGGIYSQRSNNHFVLLMILCEYKKLHPY
jgi:hypothetical protein